jgi:CubicO group peptidase (beta-lactamase class C family)
MTVLEDLDELVDTLQRQYYVPGVALGLWHAGEQYTAGYGVTNTEQPLPVDADSLFQIGSISKTVTGTVLMALVEQDRLALDAPVRTYLPDLALADEAVAAAVTVRHLLTHCGGWLGDYFDDTGPGDDALARMVVNVGRLPQLAPLGALYSYNNAGFYLAGRVVEAVTGQTYEQATQALVLDPLGMTRSFFFAGEAITYRVAAGHLPVYAPAGESTLPPVARPWGLPRNANPVGGLVCSVNDQLRYARLHLGHPPAVLNAGSLAEMHRPQVPAANGEVLGLTWFTREVGGVRFMRHGGATNGQCATLELAPSQDFALSILTNSDRGSELHQAVATWLIGQLLGLRPAPLENRLPTEAEAADYVGRYSAAAADRVVYAGDGQLWLQAEPKGGFPTADSPPGERPPAVRLAACGPDQVVMLDAPFEGNRGEFLRDAAGQIVWLRAGGRLHRRQPGP